MPLDNYGPLFAEFGLLDEDQALLDDEFAEQVSFLDFGQKGRELVMKIFEEVLDFGGLFQVQAQSSRNGKFFRVLARRCLEKRAAKSVS